jgi:hypothetical protein
MLPFGINELPHFQAEDPMQALNEAIATFKAFNEVPF